MLVPRHEHEAPFEHLAENLTSDRDVLGYQAFPLRKLLKRLPADRVDIQALGLGTPCITAREALSSCNRPSRCLIAPTIALDAPIVAMPSARFLTAALSLLR